MPVGHSLCLLGTGAIANDHMRAFDRIGLEDRRWAVSRRPDAAERFAKEWGFANWGTNAAEALGDPNVTLVVIASPSTVHVEQALMALDAGKNVAVEIPVAVALEGAEMVESAAVRSGNRLFVCHTMRSFPAIREVKRRVDAGDLSLTHIAGFFAVPRRDNQGWDRPRNWADDLLWHHACHMVDATLWVLGARGISNPGLRLGRRHRDLPMVMDLSLQFSCGEGVVVSHDLTYNADILQWEIRFIGERNVVVFRDGALVDEAGDVMIRSSIRDLEAQDAEILESLAADRPSRYDLEALMPAYRALAALEITTGDRR